MVRETIVWETGGGAAIKFLTLTNTNYTEWPILMKIALQDAGLWEDMDTGEATEWQEHQVLGAILRSVSSDTISALAAGDNAKTYRLGHAEDPMHR
jgi:hypothetical protein